MSTPSSISGLQLWLDGNDVNGNNANPSTGTALSSWKDKSTNAITFTQSTTANKPTFVSGVLNGCGGVQFSAGNCNYVSAAVTNSIQTWASGATVFIMSTSIQGGPVMVKQDSSTFGTWTSMKTIWFGNGTRNTATNGCFPSVYDSANSGTYLIPGEGYPSASIYTFIQGANQVSASSSMWSASYAFDKDFTSLPWANNNNTYTSTAYSGSYTTSVSGVGSVSGEWLQLQCYTSFVLKSYIITSDSGDTSGCAPSQWYLVASNDGSTWTQLDYRSSQTFTFLGSPAVTQKYSTSSNSTSYKYYRLIVQRNNASIVDHVKIRELQFFDGDNGTGNEYPSSLNAIYKGTSLNTSVLSSSYNSTTDNATNMFIGAMNSSTCLTGVIGEIIQYNRVLTDSERLTVASYLQAKWFGNYSSKVPSTIPGLIVWLDGNDINGNGSANPSVNSKISSWKDKSSNGFNFANANSASQPTYTTTGTNGKGGVTFNSVSSTYLQSAVANSIQSWISPTGYGAVANSATVIVVTTQVYGGVLLYKGTTSSLSSWGSGEHKIYFENGTVSETATGVQPSLVGNSRGYYTMVTNASNPVEYPSASLSGGSGSPTGSGYTKTLTEGTYTIKASAVIGSYDPYFAFDKSYTTAPWATAGQYYTSNPATYSGGKSTTVSGSTVNGEWIQLQVPTSFVLKGYAVTAEGSYNTSSTATRTASQFVLAGSTDGSTWTTIDSQTTQVFFSGERKIYSVSGNTTSYNYYRFIIKANNSSTADYGTLQELQLYTSSISATPSIATFLVGSVTTGLVNFAPPSSVASSSYAIASPDPATYITLGAGPSTPYFTGTVCEVLIYNNAVNYYNMFELLKYLNAKYAAVPINMSSINTLYGLTSTQANSSLNTLATSYGAGTFATMSYTNAYISSPILYIIPSKTVQIYPAAPTGSATLTSTSCTFDGTSSYYNFGTKYMNLQATGLSYKLSLSYRYVYGQVWQGPQPIAVDQARLKLYNVPGQMTIEVGGISYTPSFYIAPGIVYHIGVVYNPSIGDYGSAWITIYNTETNIRYTTIVNGTAKIASSSWTLRIGWDSGGFKYDGTIFNLQMWNTVIPIPYMLSYNNVAISTIANVTENSSTSDDTSITLRWTNPNPIYTSLVITWSGGIYKLLGSDTPTSYTISSLTPNTAYTFKLYSLNANNISNGGYGTITKTTTFSLMSATGLYWRYYTGVFDTATWTDTQTPTYTGLTTFNNLANIDYPTINGWIVQTSRAAGDTTLVTGYITPSVSGNYTFSGTVDDDGYLWIGANALSGYTLLNANWHTTYQSSSYSTNLTANTEYAFRYLYRNGGGGYSVSISISGGSLSFRSTVPKSSLLSGLRYYIRTGWTSGDNGLNTITNSNITYTGTTVNLYGISNATGGRYGVNALGGGYILWVGFFYTYGGAGTYTFTIDFSDNYSWLWFGTNAIAPNYSTSNANLASAYYQGSAITYTTSSLTANTYYPIRILYNDDGGGSDFQLKVTIPGGTVLQDCTNYFYSNGLTT